MLAAEYVGQPVAFEAILGILQDQERVLMETLIVQANSFLENQQIGAIGFSTRKLTLIGVISSNQKHLKHRNRYKVKNQHFYFNPEKHFELQEKDMLVVLGRDYSIEHFQDQIEKTRLGVRI